MGDSRICDLRDFFMTKNLFAPGYDLESRKALKRAVDKGLITVREALDLDIRFIGEYLDEWSHSFGKLNHDRVCYDYRQKKGEPLTDGERAWCELYDKCFGRSKWEKCI